MFSLKTFTKPIYEVELADGTKSAFDPIALMSDLDDKFTEASTLIFELEGQKILRELLHLPADTPASAVVALYADLKTFVNKLEYVKNISTPQPG